jgi:hypothetical protein
VQRYDSFLKYQTLERKNAKKEGARSAALREWELRFAS